MSARGQNSNNKKKQPRYKRDGSKRKNNSSQGINQIPAVLNTMSSGFVLDGTRMNRSALDFTRNNKTEAYHFVRGTTSFNSYLVAGGGTFTTNTNLASITQSAGATPTFFSVGIAPRLDDLADYTEFTNLFDQYCIIGVKFTFSLRAMPEQAGTTANNSGPTNIIVASDNADNAAFPSMAQAREWMTAKEVYGIDRPQFVYMFQPRVAVGTYAGAFSGYAAPPPIWVDTQSPNVQHYAIKIGVPPAPSAGTSIVWDMEAYYHIVCRMGR